MLDPHGDNFPIFPGLVALLLVLLPMNASAAVQEAHIPGIIRTIVAAESSGRPWVVGDGGASRGLMQIQKATWKRYTNRSWMDAFNPKVNRQVGELHVRDIIKRYGHTATVARVIFTYNTGRICKGPLPRWTKKHPNKVYRRIFEKEARRARVA